MSNLNIKLAWGSVRWKTAEFRVSRLQRRIYTAKANGFHNRVHWLQKLLINSLDAKLLSVRLVTTLNKGRKTPGIDKQVVISSKGKMDLAKDLKLDGKACSVKRVWVPKPGKTEKRPLGIPTIKDRAKQALAKLALEPEWEAVFEPNSYGFRPGRSAQDAIEAIFSALHHNSPKYVFDADIRKCFDKIDHTYLLAKLNTFPQMKEQVASWLRADIFHEIVDMSPTGDKHEPSLMGTPQGGVISPLLANCALHGLENHLKNYVGGLSFKPSPKANRGVTARKKSLTIVRYADDFVVIHSSLEILNLCVKETRQWLSNAGLELSEEKSSVKDVRQSFTFLGFQICQLMNQGRYKVKITPSRRNQERFREKVHNIIHNKRAVSSYELISILRPIVIGWANYYRFSECAAIFSKNSHLIFQMLRHWVFRRHPREGRLAVKQKYWPSGNTYNYDGQAHKDNWVLCGKSRVNREVVYNHLPHMVWVQSRKWVKIQGIRSPYDSDHAYWALRNSKYSAYPLPVSTLYKRQEGRCTLCHFPFDSFSRLEVDHIIPKSSGGKDEYSNLQLLHEGCQVEKTAADRRNNLEANRRKGKSSV